MSKAYTNYIVEHCGNVAKAYQWLVDHKVIQDDFIHRIKAHDLSKWSEDEYKAYDKYFYGTSLASLGDSFLQMERMMDLAKGTCLRNERAENVKLWAVSGLKRKRIGLMKCLYIVYDAKTHKYNKNITFLEMFRRQTRL